ncbi:lymphokine-activated killer T-cell-originated protein kinase-like [Lytechinus variegatus]|uniref:lymphokine-activated killer T-cell-originated protein kinase-like n=1 Tax=Lytechinus variegatus TaxID=7654 RepID=UPI001BB29696|nr:lymphokine-activated killer T-cell-originated protein kinase-like [Lytechinus variegatus]
MASTKDQTCNATDSLKKGNSDFLTPVHPAKRSRLSAATPARNSPANTIQIPASPFMKKLGWGTGVSVYLLERSPKPDGSGRSPWAVKKVRSKYKKDRGLVDVEGRLKKEAVILKKMDHPNIVEFRALSKSADGSLCLSMENGQQSLMDMIEKRNDMGKGPFPAVQIYRVALSLASALSYLHNDLKYLHGDLKSGNVLVKGDFETVKLCDFGVALKLRDDLNGLENPTDDYIGSQPWNAMEVHIGGEITHKTDMFSYGLVIWEMMSLEAPHLDLLYTGDDSEYDDDETSFDESEFEAALGTRPPLPKENLGPEFQSLIELFCACTDEDPAKRPSAKMALSALEDVKL